MNKTHASPWHKLLYAGWALIVFTVLFAIAVTQPTEAHATTWISKGEMDKIGVDMGTINFYPSCASVSGDVKKKTWGKISDGYEREMSYCLKYSTSKSTTYENPLTYTANNVGKIDGKSVNMTLKVTKVKITKASKAKVDTDGVIRFASIDRKYHTFTIGTYGYTGDTVKVYGLNGDDTGVRVTVKYTVTFSDGAGFIHKIANINQDGEGEEWTGNSGFKETFVRSGSSMKTGDHWGTSASKGNCYKDMFCATDGSAASGTYKGGNCSMTLRLYVPNFPDAPSKTSSTSEAKVGENFEWSITRNMPTFYKDTIATYRQCTIYDRLDSRLKYVSARVYLGSTDVTGSGTLSVNGQDVTWSANSGFLGNKSNYNGAILKMVLTTQATGIGGISNEATVNYCNPITKRTIKPVYVPATINYYRDYQAGDTTPCFVDKTSDTSNAYQVNPKADAAAKRSDCSGLDGWYTDPECTKKYDGTWIPTNSDYTLNLYSKNKVTLRYGATSDSWFNKHPARSVFADKGLSDKLTDRAGGKTASGASIFPAAKEAYYGDTVGVASGKSLWFESKLFGSGEKATREIKCSDGIYAYEDGSGDLLKEVRLTCDSTAYLKWLAGSYDGVYAGS